MTDTIKVAVTDDIIEAAGAICRYLNEEQKVGKVWHGPLWSRSCMLALALTTVNPDATFSVDEETILETTGAEHQCYEVSALLSAYIQQFDDWIEDNTDKPEPFCFYVGDTTAAVSEEMDA